MAHSESNESRSASRQSRRSERGQQKRRQSSNVASDTCLYIGNIDKRVTQEKLNQIFSEFGQLDYCYIVYEPYSASDRNSRTEPKQSRGYGFAKYKIHEDTLKAKEKMHGTDLNGRRLTVELSKRNKPREPTPGRYLGKKRASPVRRSPSRRSHHRKRSYSRSSSRSKSKSHRRSRRYHEKKRRHQRSRSRSDSYRRRRSSYSKSPRR